MKEYNKINDIQKQETNKFFEVKTADILLDLMLLLDENYNAELKVEGDGLKINFFNGQDFCIQVSDI